MPIANIKVIEGVFSNAEKQQMIEKVTEALMEVEGVALREYTTVYIEEVKSGSWGIGGRVLTTEMVKGTRGGS